MSARKRIRRVALPALAALLLPAAVALAIPGKAAAKPGIRTGIAAPSEFGSPDPSIRALWFENTAKGNADLARVDVVWRSVVGSERPASPRDPADPAYDFSSLDAAVREAQRRGLKVFFTVYSAPDWAEADRSQTQFDWAPGTWKPNPDEYGDFATALARRYSGSFSPAAGLPPLPRVRYFEAWNEPNLGHIFLAPQWNRDGKPVGPSIYRRLLNAFYAGVKAVNENNLVIGPATSSAGDSGRGTRMRPLRFLRELLCLDGRRKLKPKPCPDPARFDIVSHHPINPEKGPRYSAIHPDDAMGADLDQVKKVVRAAEKARTVLPRERRPLWATEFWWFSDPPNKKVGVPLDRHARWIEQALYEYWKQGARAAIYFLIRDASGPSGFTTGLFFANGRKKPAFRAFSFPFVADRRSRKRVLAWGKAPSDGRLRIEVRGGGRWKTAERLRARDGEVFKTRLSLRGKARLRASVGGERSLVWRQRR